MESSLPSTLDFSKKLPELPSGVKATLMSVQTTNGISFSPSQVLQWDLPARKGLFIDGKTAFIRFKISATSTAGTGVFRRKPVYSVFSRLDEFVGSTPCNSVYLYNQVANMIVDTNYNLADTLGQQFSWGLSQTAALTDLDGVATSIGANDLYVSAPLLGSFLPSADKLIPTGLMAPIRIQLTVDTITNIFNTATDITALTISQPELCFSAIDMGADVEDAIAMSSPQLLIKSQGWANATQGVAAGTAGFNTLSFNHRYKSIENLYFLSSSSVATKAFNLWGDSFNPMGLAGQIGSIQAMIGQDVYPQLPINNATGGVASIQQYLRECVGQIADNRNSMSIFNVNFNQYANGSAASSTDAPAKFIVGFPLSKINSPSPYSQVSLMSGADASSMPINVLLNAGSSFNSNMNFSLIAQYTQVLTIDTTSKQVAVIC